MRDRICTIRKRCKFGMHNTVWKFLEWESELSRGRDPYCVVESKLEESKIAARARRAAQ